MPDLLPSLAPINVHNASKVGLQAVLSYGTFTSVAWSADEKIIAVGSTRGIWLHRGFKDHPTQLQTTIRAVNAIDISPDSLWLASVEADSVVRLWNLTTGDEVRSFHVNEAKPINVKFSPREKLLLVSYADGNVRVWDVTNEELIATLLCTVELPPEHSRPYFLAQNEEASHRITYLIINNTGDMLAACANEYTNIFIWDMTSYTLVHRFNIMGWTVDGISFAEESNLLTAMLRMEKAHDFRLWNVQSGQLEDTISSYVPYPGARSKNNVWAYEDQTSILGRVVNTRTGQKLPLHISVGGSPAFNHDETQWIAQSVRGTLGLWDMEPLQWVDNASIPFAPPFVEGLVFSPDSTLLAVVERERVQIWDVQSSRIQALLEFSSVIESYTFHPNDEVWFDAQNELRFSHVTKQNVFQIYNLSKNELVEEQQLPEIIYVAGNRVATFNPHTNMLAYWKKERILALWDVERRQERVMQYYEKESALWLRFSPNGKYLAMITYGDKKSYIFNVQTNDLMLTLSPPDAITFSPLEDVAFVTIWFEEEQDNGLMLWDLATVSRLARLPSVSSWMKEVAFNPSGEIAILGAKNCFEFWHWKTQALLGSVTLTGDESFLKLKISPDGKMIATVSQPSRELRIWGVTA